MINLKVKEFLEKFYGDRHPTFVLSKHSHGLGLIMTKLEETSLSNVLTINAFFRSVNPFPA